MKLKLFCTVKYRLQGILPGEIKVDLGLHMHHISDSGYHMGLAARKPVFGGLRTTKAQHLLFTYWKVAYLNWLLVIF